MAYRELGEARILKRYNGRELLTPARTKVIQQPQENWRSVEDAAQCFLDQVKTACVAVR